MKVHHAIIVLATSFGLGLLAARMTSSSTPVSQPARHPLGNPHLSSTPALVRSEVVPAGTAPVGPPAVPRAAAYDRAALIEAMTFPSTLHRHAALKLLFDRMSVDEFPKALHDIQTFGGIPEPEAVQMLFRSWAEVAPHSAVEHALAMPIAGGRADLLGAAVRAWGRKDLKAARLWAEQNLNGIDRDMNLRYLESLAEADPASRASAAGAGLAQLLSEPGSPDTSAKIRALFSDWIQKDPAAASHEVMKIHADNDRKDVALAVIREWVQRDPRATAAWLSSLPEDRFKQLLQGNMVGFLADANLTAAKECAATIKNPGTRRDAMEGIARRMLKKDPESAITLYLAELSHSPNQHGPWWFFGDWLAADPKRASEALMQFPVIAKSLENSNEEEETLGAVPKMVLEPLAKTNAVAAAEIAMKFTGRNRASAIYTVAEEWCARDASAAGAWAAAQPAGSGQNEALRQICYVWAKHDAGQVTTWLESLPVGSGKSAAAEGFAFSVFDSDPDAAVAWLRVIPDEKDRLSRLSRAWNKWHEDNSVNAGDWLKKATDLTAAERATLQKTADED